MIVIVTSGPGVQITETVLHMLESHRLGCRISIGKSSNHHSLPLEPYYTLQNILDFYPYLLPIMNLLEIRLMVLKIAIKSVPVGTMSNLKVLVLDLWPGQYESLPHSRHVMEYLSFEEANGKRMECGCSQS